MPELFHVLLPTDVFPPNCGGSGWSTHALASALQRRGHRVTAIVPRQGKPGLRRDIVAGVPVVKVGYTAPRLPFVANVYRFELLWPLLRNVLIAEACREHQLPVIIHGQHAQTIPAAVLAARELARPYPTPVLATIRDAWPWHYFATGLLGDRVPTPHANAGTAWLDLLGRLGALKGVLAAPAVPYMLGHVERRAALLAQADAVIAVSNYMAGKLRRIVSADRLHVIPNLIDLSEAQRTANEPSLTVPDEPFVLFVGKLERNKGVHLLPSALLAARAAGAELPLLLIAGTGVIENELGQQLTKHGFRYRCGWTNHDDVLRLMLRAEVLLYPSAWGEPLTRVLVEASAVGACIAAINTGGTSDIIVDGESGVLVDDEIKLGHALAALLAAPNERRRLRAGAQRVAAERFAADVVASRVEALYRTLYADKHRDTPR